MINLLTYVLILHCTLAYIELPLKAETIDRNLKLSVPMKIG